MKKPLLHKLRILFATFSPYRGDTREATNGNVEPMIAYFAPRVSVFTLVDQPHTGSTDVVPFIERYKDGKQLDRRTLNRW